MNSPNSIRVELSIEDGDIIARIIDRPGCFTHVDRNQTAGRLFNQIQEVAELWDESWEQTNKGETAHD